MGKQGVNLTKKGVNVRLQSNRNQCEHFCNYGSGTESKGKMS